METKVILKMAMTPSWLVGNSDNPPYYLPWGPEDLPGELNLFKEETTGFPVIMGRNTAETFGGEPLPNRPNIVVSRSGGVVHDGFRNFSSLEDAIEAFRDKTEKIFVIGGAKLATYALSHNLIDEMRITLTHRDDFEGKVYLPEWDKKKWQEVHRQKYDGYDVITYRRIQ